MKKLYLFALLSLVLLMPSIVKANCDNEDSIKIHKKARNITTSYLYDEENSRYYITLNNITDEFKVYNYRLGSYINSNNGEANIIVNAGGEYRFDISLRYDTCGYGTLEYKYVNLPFYNRFYNSEICKGIEEYKYCQKWFTSYQYDSKVIEQINNYKESLKENNKKEESKKIKSIFEYVLEFLIKYYRIIAYIVLPIILVILIVMIIRKRKKEDLF